MDQKFIKTLCEGYYNDFELGKYSIWKNKDDAIFELYESIIDTIHEVKLDFPELYIELFNLDKYKQYQLTYGLIDSYLEGEYNETFMDINTHMYDDLELNMEFTGFELVSAIAGLTALITLKSEIESGAKYVAKPVFKSISKIIGKLNELMTSAAVQIDKKTKAFTIINHVIYNEDQNCVKRCGLDLAVLGTTHFSYVNPKSNSKIRKNQIEQYDCVFTCYLNTQLLFARQYLDAYFTCLKQNNAYDIKLLSEPTTLLTVQQPLSDSCSVYFSICKNHFKLVSEVIEACYKNKPDEKKLWLDKYTNVIKDSTSQNPTSPKLLIHPKPESNYKSNYKPPYKSSPMGNKSKY